MKKSRLELRLTFEEKEKLINICKKLNCTYTQYISSRITGDLDFGTSKRIFDYILKEDYFYSKVETNINQIARIVNAEKQISDCLLQEHNQLLRELVSLTNEKRKIMKRICLDLL